MTLSERCTYLWSVFQDLQNTSSILEKRFLISRIPKELVEDFNYVIECLNGKHKFGYAYNASPYYSMSDKYVDGNLSVKEVLEWLQEPRIKGDLSQDNIDRYCDQTVEFCWFFEPIINRTLKLGIGQSILPKNKLAPMLAKRYEDAIKYDSKGYILTEKLDGNRCIASYENGKWVFRSRNGRLMYLDFDMGDLPTDFVYDGEVMSMPQTIASMKLITNLRYSTQDYKVYDNEFNTTSGVINRHTKDKELVYNIFDIMIDGVTYCERRDELDRIATEIDLPADIRIVPVIAKSVFEDLDDVASYHLSRVCNMGGEGIMINLAGGLYNHKRTDQLLKLKQVQSIDMEVIAIREGLGKYECAVGALICQCKTDDGKIIEVSVGSGLSDEQRLDWFMHPEKIIGKIVEVQYFSISQDNKRKDSNYYSLRFPRLKTVRIDKNTTSQY